MSATMPKGRGVTVDPFRVVIDDSPGRSPIQVSIEPRVCDRPSRWFRSETEAMEFAQALAKIEGWPIEDRRIGGDA